jgi:diguanylate cyclase (GGDEF)-like protein
MKKLRIILLLSVLLQAFSLHSPAQDKEVNILVLMTYHQSFPWAESFIAGLNRSRLQYNKRINLYLETMETFNYKTAISDLEWIDYLSKKYKFVAFNAVIAESMKACDFLNKYSQLFALKIPKIFYTGSAITERLLNKVFSEQYDECVKKTVELALIQNPDSKNLFIIQGDEKSNLKIIVIIKELLKTRHDLTLHIIENFSIKELTDSIGKIPENSIIFYTIIRKDRHGEAVVSRKLLTDLSKLSKAPIYSFWSSLMGSGIIGGHMFDGASTAGRMVDAAMDYIDKGKYKDNYNTLKTFIDWNALDRFGINKNTISASDTFILNKPLSILDNYFAEVMGAIAAVAFLLSIIFLYWSRKLSGLNKKLEEINIEMKFAKEKAEELARVDTLTGLNNRRVFFEMGLQICKEVKRLDKHVSLLMLDIDNFKIINDTYGHIQGDIVLKKLAEILNKCKREYDVSIRFGGEEFIVMAPFTDKQGAKNLAERIRNEAENSIILFEDKEIRFTISIGVFSTIPSRCDMDFGIKCADDALYTAKAKGKNQVVLWEAPYVV